MSFQLEIDVKMNPDECEMTRWFSMLISIALAQHWKPNRITSPASEHHDFVLTDTDYVHPFTSWKLRISGKSESKMLGFCVLITYTPGKFPEVHNSLTWFQLQSSLGLNVESNRMLTRELTSHCNAMHHVTHTRWAEPTDVKQSASTIT